MGWYTLQKKQLRELRDYIQKNPEVYEIFYLKHEYGQMFLTREEAIDELTSKIESVGESVGSSDLFGGEYELVDAAFRINPKNIKELKNI